mmetsp:Transcript_8250/g.23590  ORF Transcript_8250/g.23590 Transcript_8250/m.23590 type:complete len:237 (-) Transcript_8250:2119-2829(-)
MVSNLGAAVGASLLGHIHGLHPVPKELVRSRPGLDLADHVHQLIHGLHRLVLASRVPLNKSLDRIQQWHQVLLLDLSPMDENLQDLEPSGRGLEVMSAHPKNRAEGPPAKLRLNAVGASLHQMEELSEELRCEDIRNLGVKLENERQGPQQLIGHVFLVWNEPLAYPQQSEDSLLHQWTQQCRRVDDRLEVVEGVTPKEVEPIPVLDRRAYQQIKAEQRPLLLLLAVRDSLGGLAG